MKTIDIILSPIITEKATKLGEKFIYLFYVHQKATKVDVKRAVEELYGHKVATVKMIVTPEKTKVIKRATVNKRPARKKAMVTLKGKKKMDFTKLSKEAAKK